MFQPQFLLLGVMVPGIVIEQVDGAGLGPAVLNALEEFQSHLTVDALALHANQPYHIEFLVSMDIDPLQTCCCPNRRSVILVEPSGSKAIHRQCR